MNKLKEVSYKGQENGITLIILSITIIILIILAGVSIEIITDGRFISKSKEIVNKANAKEQEEQDIEDEIFNEKTTERGIKSSTNVNW